jgi:hypothetical protein
MRMRRSVRPRRLGVSLVGAAAAVMMFAGTAHAVPIDPVELTGPEGATWEPEANDLYGTGGAPCTGVDGTTQEIGFTPAMDAFNDFSSDAFDGGLFLLVNGDAFGNGINNGVLSGDGHQLTVGPQTKGGLAITRRERALQTSPTLRSLVRFTNTHATRRTVNVVWDSAMGADEEEGTRASSSGDLLHSEADRWIVASDDPVNANLSDPPVLFVFYGKFAPRKVKTVVWAPEDPPPANGIGAGCVAVRYSLTVPAKSTRYLLFFTDLGMDNDDAIAQAVKYNTRRLDADLLVGISLRVKERIVNWDLT